MVKGVLCLCAGCGYSFWAWGEDQMPDGPHCTVHTASGEEYKYYRWLYDTEALDFILNPDLVQREYVLW